MKKIVLTFVVLLSFVGLFLLLQNRGAENDGEVIIIVHDGEKVVFEETFSYYQGDTLFDLVNEHLDLVCANSSYKPSEECNDLLLGSPVILGINDVITDWTSSYFAIYINDTYSNLGVDMIELEDGDVVRFEVQEVGGE